MLFTHKGAANWAQLVTKDLYKWEHSLFPFLFWDQCQQILNFHNPSVWLKADTGQIAPIIFPCSKTTSRTVLCEACSRQYVSLLKSLQANVCVIPRFRFILWPLLHELLHDVAPYPSAVLAVTQCCVLSNEAEKSETFGIQRGTNCWTSSKQLLDSE